MGLIEGLEYVAGKKDLEDTSEDEEEKEEICVGDKKEISKWLLYGTYILGILIVIADFLDNLYYFYDLGTAGAMGATTWSVIGLLIAIGCGHKCASWASELEGKSLNFAYGIGFFAGLLGLLGYYCYYRYKRMKEDD